MFIALPIILRSGASFFARNWKIILLAVLLVGYTYAVYRAGRYAADELWVVKHNTEVDKQNARILELESLSVRQAEEIDAAAIQLKKRLTALTADRPKIVPRTRGGQELRCGAEMVGEVFLGPEFSQRWNSINKEVNK